MQPQAAYSGYLFEFKHKFTFFGRTVPDIAEYVFPIEETLNHVPPIMGVYVCSNEERAYLHFQWNLVV